MNLVIFRGIAELVAAVMEGVDMEEEAGEDPDLDPDQGTKIIGLFFDIFTFLAKNMKCSAA